MSKYAAVTHADLDMLEHAAIRDHDDAEHQRIINEIWHRREARTKFQERFENYHPSCDGVGLIPRHARLITRVLNDNSFHVRRELRSSRSRVFGIKTRRASVEVQGWAIYRNGDLVAFLAPVRYAGGARLRSGLTAVLALGVYQHDLYNADKKMFTYSRYVDLRNSADRPRTLGL